MSNGKRIEGEGVIPDETIPTTLRDLQVGRSQPSAQSQETVGC